MTSPSDATAHPVPSGESERLEERLRQDAADVERITDTHTAMVVRPVLVKRLREAADELTRLRAEAARYREALEEAEHDLSWMALAVEGHRNQQRAMRTLNRVRRSLTTEGGDRAEE